MGENKMLKNISVHARSRKIILWPGLISALLWIMNAFSAGFFEYYGESLYGAIGKGVGNKLIFAVWTNNFHLFLDLSGLYWFPTYHFGVSLPIFPLFFTLYLSYALFVTLRDIFASWNKKNRRTVVAKFSYSFLVSTLTTGACCTFPIIYFAIAIFVSASTSLAFDIFLGRISYLIDVLNGTFLIWLHRRNRIKRDNRFYSNT